jgi:hypothetical protein
LTTGARSVGLFELLDLKVHRVFTALFYENGDVTMIERLLVGQDEIKTKVDADREKMLPKMEATQERMGTNLNI